MRIAIVSCSKKKLPICAEARDLYCSPLFQASRAYAERFCDEWYILSALHGLMLPRQVVIPYDRSLSGLTRSELSAWAMATHWDLINRFPFHYLPEYEFLVLAAYPYSRAMCGMRTQQPLVGMGIGSRVKWLKKRVEEGRP